MKTILLRLLSVSLVLLLVGLPPGIVHAKGISAVMVSGPGIQGELTLDDPDEMLGLMQAGFMDQIGYMAKPSLELGTPYTISIMFNLDAPAVPFIRMDYYPIGEGQAGYVHYIARYDGSKLVETDEWGLMPLPAEALFRKLLSERGIELQSALAASAPAPQAAAPAVVPVTRVLFSPSLPLGLILVLVLVAAGLLLRRRMLKQVSAR